MFSSALVLAEVAAHPGNGSPSVGEQITQITDTFGLNVPGLLAQIVSFSVVAWVLWRFAFKPVLATINERQHTIESGLKYAEEMKAKLAAAEQHCAAMHKQAQQDATRIVEDARNAAKDFLQKQMQEATVRANDTIAKAQQAIELEHKKMLADARTEIARLVVATTERVLAKRLTDTDRSAYNEAASRELVEARS